MRTEAERRRIEEDLRGLLAGEVHCGDLFAQLYSSDASIFEIRPLGVVRPRSVEDVVATVRYASENNIPLHARGAGSGLAGESLGEGLVIDFSRHLRRILSVEESEVRVQAGVVLQQLNSRLERHGQCFGPDPATANVTTMGGMVAVDSSGSRWRAYGSARRNVRELEVVLTTGDVVRLGRHRLPTDQAASSVVDRLAVGLADIRQKYDVQLRNHPVASCVDRSGYQIQDAASDSEVDLAKVVAGSEGTLALITELTLSTAPLPRRVGSILFFFNSLRKAAEAAVLLSKEPIRACDLMDRRHLSLARELDPRYELLVPQAAEAVLLVECEADSQEYLLARLHELVRLVQKTKEFAADAQVAVDQCDQQLLWQLARKFVPTLNRLRGSVRPVPYVEDIAVPPTALPEFLDAALGVLRRRQITASIFGHAAHGQLHIRPLVDLAKSEEVENLHRLAAELYEEVWRVKGSISGEHGEGVSRRAFLSRQYGALAPAYQEVKRLFDPANILNPGRKTPTKDGFERSALRRIASTTALRNGTSVNVTSARQNKAAPTLLQLDWEPAEMALAAWNCNGCAGCRSLHSETRMCPIFRYSPREEASPRAKANLARAVLAGALPDDILLDEACKQIADLCVHCHSCRIECPSNVDIPKLMVEAKAQHIATNGQGLQDTALARIDSLSRYAARFPRLVNALFSNRTARWALERMLGVAQGRKLPTLNRRPVMGSPLQRRHNRLPDESGPAVMLFVDTYANYYDAQLFRAIVTVLEHNNVGVFVPDGQGESGMPLISQGVLDPARKIAERNVVLLAEAVRQGCQIISTEPSAVLAIRREYRHLLGDDSDAELVAQRTIDATSYLWSLHQQGRLKLDLRPLDIRVGYHLPCHLLALEPGNPTVHLLNLIPGLQVSEINKGCSGIAGVFGFKKQHYRRSLRAGLPLLNEMRTGRFQAGVTDCSTCRIQMEQGSAKPTIHPVKLLALSYGLMPELGELLRRPNQELTVR